MPSPVDVLAGVFADEYRQITERLAALRAVVADLGRLATAADGQAVSRSVRLLAAAEVERVSLELGTGARQEVLDWQPQWVQAWPSQRLPGHRILRDSRCDPHDPAAEIRVVESVPAFLRLVDTRTILMAPKEDPALVISSEWLATGLRQQFELAWERAIALSDGPISDTLTPAQRQVLQLMAAGMDDAGVARKTGTSIRTVRAHVAAIMNTLGARTRLAAGVEAARRGWLA